MYRIREVDGHEDEITDTLADLHRLTFLKAHQPLSSIGDIGGLLITSMCRSPSVDWFRRLTRRMRDISAGSA
jgi:hypothetical protein